MDLGEIIFTVHSHFFPVKSCSLRRAYLTHKLFYCAKSNSSLLFIEARTQGKLLYVGSAQVN